MTSNKGIKRVFLIVLDSVGAGELPDAEKFGDKGCNTLRSVSESKSFFIPNLKKLGIGNIEGLEFLGNTERPSAAVCKLAEVSQGKDSTIGHWEIAGVISEHQLPTFPDGFPKSVIDEFSSRTGRGVLCNMPYSGTQVINDYGDEHVESGDLILYTSADSVFQIAAHEEVVPVDQLYEYCNIARELLQGDLGVGRVIARPFKGSSGNYIRTADRRDFSIATPEKTVLDALNMNKIDVISVGKIKDLFAERGITEFHMTHSNAEGMSQLSELAKKDFCGLCFANLVDFDMLYGHRNNVDGYAMALSEFDKWLGDFLTMLNDDDILMITADHGCDPGDISTDHTREYVPLIVYGHSVNPVGLGKRKTFADIAATLADIFDVEYSCIGKSMFGELTDSCEYLASRAVNAMQMSYSPYSGYKVGAALLTSNGKVYTGCNIENSAFSPTVCAERTAIFKAISEGEKCFVSIAIAGGRDGIIDKIFPPCGVCRQVMAEFCNPDSFEVILVKAGGYEKLKLKELLPCSFGL